MRLAVFYAVIAVAYLALAYANAHLAQVAVPFVTFALLAPAAYAEWLRVKGRRDGS